ncbi:hypothetical protein ACE1OC_01470 [Streptomyces sp. DSM 116496]|uniref:hypothetical protein n=1 Tax=Streptomyces stoeckheimensis TaxID=3344656 RepID=UPI0038B28204
MTPSWAELSLRATSVPSVTAARRSRRRAPGRALPPHRTPTPRVVTPAHHALSSAPRTFCG